MAAGPELGLALQLAEGWTAELQYGADRQGMGVAPDVAFRLVLMRRSSLRDEGAWSDD